MYLSPVYGMEVNLYRAVNTKTIHLAAKTWLSNQMVLINHHSHGVWMFTHKANPALLNDAVLMHFV